VLAEKKTIAQVFKNFPVEWKLKIDLHYYIYQELDLEGQRKSFRIHTKSSVRYIAENIVTDNYD
jgi:hypothetical protein